MIPPVIEKTQCITEVAEKISILQKYYLEDKFSPAQENISIIKSVQKTTRRLMIRKIPSISDTKEALASQYD